MKVEKREIRIHNVVALAAFKHGIDLDAIVKAFPHVEYRREIFYVQTTEKIVRD